MIFERTHSSPPEAATFINAVFLRICDLGIELGWNNIKARPGCTEHQIDDHWWFAINPHPERCPSSHHKNGTAVPPHSIYVEYEDWPYAVIQPDGAMRGPITVEQRVDDDALLDAVEDAILRLKAERRFSPAPSLATRKERCS